MKKNLVWLMAIFTLISCDKEAVPEKVLAVQNRKTVLNENSDNETEILSAAELKGQLFYKLTTEFNQNYGLPDSIRELTDQIRYISENWPDKAPPLTREITPQYLNSMRQNPMEELTAIVKNRALSQEAGTGLIKFIENLMDSAGQNSQLTADFITAYKVSVIENAALTEKDKEVMVTVAVISGYALYAESDRKDRDWETSVANKIAPSFFKQNQAPLMAVIALMERCI